MSEMTAPMDPTVRLRTHVDSVLARSSVPAAEREDIAEELYSHLWQRWQDAMAAGANALEAAEAAIRSFGEASRLGQEMTGAYHSRLYATTIGRLLPAVAAPPGRPEDFAQMTLLLALMALFQLFLVGTFLDLTPGRAVVLAAGAGLSIAVSVLAVQAFVRAQRWALRYCQFVVAVVLVQGATTLLSYSPRGSDPPGGVAIPILTIMGLWALGPALSPEIAEWFSHSRPIGRGLAVALTVAIGAGFLLPPLATAMPDPTQASASDLDLRVATVCTRDAGGGVTDMEVTTSLRWSRLDLLPFGLGRPETPSRFLDRVTGGVLLSGGASASEWRTTWIAVPDYVSHYGADAVDVDGLNTSGGQASAVRQFYVGGSTEIGVEFLPNEPLAGQTYTIVHRLHWPQPDYFDEPPPADPLVAVWYSHLDRFVVQALASCEQPGTGVLVGSEVGG